MIANHRTSKSNSTGLRACEVVPTLASNVATPERATQIAHEAESLLVDRILFVDDDPLVLAGLKNAFRRDRARWHTVFVPGGEAALRELEQGPFDVVISDMRMPGMCGVSLLTHIKQRSPSTVRLMLSGSADTAEIGLALAIVDELIAKPSDTSTLRATIERWLGSRHVCVAAELSTSG
jgi:CheY-like chemotaxis protein